MRNAARSLVVCLALFGASNPVAQERGRTDGPEGSEIGKGGYTSGPGGLGGFSVTLDGGGAITIKGSQFSPPLYAGLTASFWDADFYRIDLSGFYVPDPKLWGVLLGPSFHTTTWPIAFSAGFQAGLHIPHSGSVNFIISPRVGMDWITTSHFQLGVFANFDINLADFDRSIVRVGLSVGWRF